MEDKDMDLLMNVVDTAIIRAFRLGSGAVDCSEIKKLDEMLTESGIPHEMHPFYEGYQITYSKDGEWEWRKSGCGDVVVHNTSYGHEKGLLEAGGFNDFITEEEYGDEVVGWLTAEEAFEFFRKQYEKDTEKK